MPPDSTLVLHIAYQLVAITDAVSTVQYFFWVAIALGIELFGNRDDSRFYVRLTHGLGWHYAMLAMHHLISVHGTIVQQRAARYSCRGGDGMVFSFTLFAGLGLRRLYVAVSVIN